MYLLLALLALPLAHADDTKAKAKTPGATRPVRITQRCAVDVDGDQVDEDVVLLTGRTRAQVMVLDANTVAFLFKEKFTTAPKLECQPKLTLRVDGNKLTWSYDGRRYLRATAPDAGPAVRPDAPAPAPKATQDTDG